MYYRPSKTYSNTDLADLKSKPKKKIQTLKPNQNKQTTAPFYPDLLAHSEQGYRELLAHSEQTKPSPHKIFSFEIPFGNNTARPKTSQHQ